MLKKKMGGVLGFGQESNLCFKPDPGRVHGLHAHGVVLLAYRGAAAESGGLPERDGNVGGRVVPDEGMFNMPNNHFINIDILKKLQMDKDIYQNPLDIDTKSKVSIYQLSFNISNIPLQMGGWANTGAGKLWRSVECLRTSSPEFY